ncbi:MAG TPA: MarR family transcriptional regulator [Candidatus Limnocylindrales bacterium]|nr:MarR family transcriptional regulator [Candidatus Limnocylindrales bacterium]
MNRENIDNVLRSLRRVNLQGSFFGQTVAIRFGLSESDIETLEALIEMGASTAGRLADLTGLTSGAVTRVIDRLEQSGYVRRTTDPADRRRVIVEVVPEKVAAIRSTLDRVGSAGAEEIGRYTDAQLALISDFLSKMEQITRDEAASIRENPETGVGAPSESENTAPLGSLHEARLTVRSGLSTLRLRGGSHPAELYRASFRGATPQVRLRDGRVLVQYRGLPFDWRKRAATFALNETIPWSVEIVGGVQRVEADLRSVETRRFELNGGTERIQLELGSPHGDAEIRIVGGASTIRIERPAKVPVRLTVVGGSGHVDLDGTRLGKKGGRTTMESRGWADATDRYDVEVVGGSKSIEIVSRR